MHNLLPAPASLGTPSHLSLLFPPQWSPGYTCLSKTTQGLSLLLTLNPLMLSKKTRLAGCRTLSLGETFTGMQLHQPEAGREVPSSPEIPSPFRGAEDSRGGAGVRRGGRKFSRYLSFSLPSDKSIPSPARSHPRNETLGALRNMLVHADLQEHQKRPAKCLLHKQDDLS